MPRAYVTITGVTQAGYHRQIASMSERQVHSQDSRMDELTHMEMVIESGSAIVIDPKKFPEVSRFVVSVQLIND